MIASFYQTFLQPLEAILIQHPYLGVVLVFFLALGESIPVLGVVAPGTSVIVAVAALAGLGYFPVWGIFLSGLAGAIIGDGLSYWYGHTYRAHALNLWPLSRYPELIARSELFFTRHGVKSITLARFTPVVRAFVPLIAGISGMDARRFYIANVLSAIGWAIVHILPAAIAGASLGILQQISIRLVIVVMVVAIATVLMIIGLRVAIRSGQKIALAAQHRGYQALEGHHGRFASFVR